MSAHLVLGWVLNETILKRHSKTHCTNVLFSVFFRFRAPIKRNFPLTQANFSSGSKGSHFTRGKVAWQAALTGTIWKSEMKNCLSVSFWRHVRLGNLVVNFLPKILKPVAFRNMTAAPENSFTPFSTTLPCAHCALTLLKIIARDLRSFNYHKSWKKTKKTKDRGWNVSKKL